MSGKRLRQWLVNVGFGALLVFTWWAGRAPRSTPGGDHGFHLTEVSKAVGIDFVHRSARLDPALDHILPHVAGMGAAVSIVDVNGDGWPDIYATNSGFGTSNALYVNQRDGRFLDVASEVGVTGDNREGLGASMGSIWADYDGDGDPDLFLYKWGYPELLRNDGGVRFVDVTRAANLWSWRNTNAACWIDFDRDGYLDLYVTGYFREDVDLWHLKTTRIMQASFEFARNGGHNVLYRNLGDGRFEDVTEQMGADSTRWTLAVAAADFDGDGWQDLYLANDYGPEELFLNKQGARFELQAGIGLDESSKSGMSVALGDFEGQGRLGVYVTNISKSGYLFQGNNLRVNRLSDRRHMENVAQDDAVDCGWAWGAQFGDLDNDGRVDLFVVNGFVSASLERDYWFGMSKVAVGLGNLAEDARSWPPMEDRSLSGYERSRVLMNAGRGRFVDVAEAVGATDLHDGRAVALADLWNRGVQDVVIANQKGPLLVYRNEVDPSRHWIQFTLTGSRGNRSAIGAQLTLVVNGQRTVQSVQAGSGFSSQNDARLHFGLGRETAVEQAVIRWPSGQTQVLERPRIDVHHAIVEPSS